MGKSSKSRSIYHFSMYVLGPVTIAVIFSSCVTSSTFIQSASLSGPAQKSMVRITDDIENEQSTLRFQFSQNLQQEIRTTASEVHSIYPADSTPPQFDLYNNVFWKLPHSEFMFDLEIPLSRVIVIFGGLNLGVLDQKTSLGKTIGFGFRGSGGDLHMRLDLSFNIQDMDYEVYYVNETQWIWGETTRTSLYDHGTLTSKNLGVGITLNTAQAEWTLNPFIHGAFGSQTIIQPKETSFIPDPPSYSDSYFNLAGGFYFRLGDRHRLVIGYGMNRHSNERGSAPWVSNVILQADIVF